MQLPQTYFETIATCHKYPLIPLQDMSEHKYCKVKVNQDVAVHVLHIPNLVRKTIVA